MDLQFSGLYIMKWVWGHLSHQEFSHQTLAEKDQSTVLASDEIYIQSSTNELHCKLADMESTQVFDELVDEKTVKNVSVTQCPLM